jgi:hypothetical protein
MSEPRSPNIKTLWQSQPQEIPPVVLEKVRADALKFRRRTQIATIREMAAASLVIVGFAIYLRFLPGVLIKAGSALGIVWALFFMWNWLRLVKARPVPDAAAECVDFHRRELEQRLEAARGAWRWGLAPVALLVVLFGIGRWIGPTAVGRTALGDHLVIIVIGVFEFESLFLMWLWSRNRMDKLQDRIDELRALGGARP